MEVNVSTTIKLHKTFLHVIGWSIPYFQLQHSKTKGKMDYLIKGHRLQTWKCISWSNKDNLFYFENWKNK